MKLNNLFTKKFLVFGAIFLVALGLSGIGYYNYTTKDKVEDLPPHLTMDLSSFMQGKMSTLKGFASLSPKGSCPSGVGSVRLSVNVNHLFSTEPISLKTISESLKYIGSDKNAQYLIAFFSPESEILGKGFNQEGWYLYPTPQAPFKSTYSINSILEKDGEKYEIPAYRGFQIIVNNNDTYLCGDEFKSSLDKDFLGSSRDASPTEGFTAKMLEFFPTLDEEAISNIDNKGFEIMWEYAKYPKGWVMLPFGYSWPDRLEFDDEVYSSSVFVQIGQNDFKNKTEVDTDSGKHLMFWINITERYDFEELMKTLHNKGLADDVRPKDPEETEKSEESEDPEESEDSEESEEPDEPEETEESEESGSGGGGTQ